VELINIDVPFGQLSVQGPLARQVLESLQLQVAQEKFAFIKLNSFSEAYVMNHPRTGTSGFDLFVHVSDIEAWATRLLDSVVAVGGCACGWEALETARVEAGIPRFGADMDSTTLPTEAGITAQAVSYQKGCYVGQEIMARLRSRGSVPAKELRGLWLPPGLDCEKLPGTRLLLGDQDAGWITSAVASPYFKGTLALGYVRTFANAEGTILETGTERTSAKVIKPPFHEEKPL
jgi:folate-binding protein YgfZ